MPRGGARLGAGRPKGRKPGRVVERELRAELKRKVAAEAREAQAEEAREAREPRFEGVRRVEAEAKQGRAELVWQRAEREGIMPLDIILRRMRGDDTVTDSQFQAACQAAPYIHPRLSAVAVQHRKSERKMDLSGLSGTEIKTLLRLVEKASPKLLTVDGSRDDAGGDWRGSR
jgi:hypothetical protein